MKKKIMIIDSFSLLYKAFYGVRPMKTSDGTPTSAVYGFVNMILKLIKDYNPEYLFAAFDAGKANFRLDSFEQYKAGRQDMPEDLRLQVPIIKELLRKANIELLICENYEADDIIGYVSHLAKEKDMQTIIVTGDRDTFQLADENTLILYARKGVSDTVNVDAQYIEQTYHLKPLQLIEVKALMGDKSDNIPGVAGVGEKTALDLIQTYHTLDGVYENIDAIKGKLQEKLIKDKQIAYISRQLATICETVPIDIDLEKGCLYDFNNHDVEDILKKLEMNSIIKSIGIKPKQAVSQEINYNKITENDILQLEGKTVSVFFDAQFFKNGSNLALSYEDKNYVMSNVSYDFVKTFCEDSKINKVVHNFKETYKLMLKEDITPRNFIFDTFLAAYLLDPSDERYDIDILSKKYLNIEIHMKQLNKQQSFFEETTNDDLHDLLSQKAELNLKLYKVFYEKLISDHMLDLYQNIEHKLMFVLGEMELEGFKVDVDMLYKLEADFDKRIAALTEKILSMAGKDSSFNINSPKQLGVLLFEEMGLPFYKKTKTGYSTDIEVLEKLKNKHDIIPLIIELRQLMKLSSTYVKGLMKITDVRTSKIHTTFNQTITTTGRISSSAPNLQNIPIKTEEGKIIRKVFIPSSENNVLIDADYSQIELRVLAHISEDEKFIDAFMNNEDIHAHTASEVFDVPIDEVTKMQRSRAKAVNFGIVYGISDYGLSRDLNIKRSDAKEYIEKYLEKFTKVKEYMINIVEKAKSDGYVTTMFNRRRYIPDINSTNFTIRNFAQRIALNTPIQGSAADIIKIAMIHVNEQLKSGNYKAKLILQVHDELIIDCPKNEVEAVKNILKNEMENAVKLRVPLVADIASADNWFDAK